MGVSVHCWHQKSSDSHALLQRNGNEQCKPLPCAALCSSSSLPPPGGLIGAEFFSFLPCVVFLVYYFFGNTVGSCVDVQRHPEQSEV